MQEEENNLISEDVHQEELSTFEEYFDSIYELILDTLRGLPEVRNEITPEQEYFLGAACTYLAIIFVFDLEILPSSLARTKLSIISQLTRELDNILELLPFHDTFMSLAGGIYFGIMVDGANRIARERVPYVHAWIKVFILDKLSDI